MNSFRADSWANYWKLCEDFFKKVTNQDYASWTSSTTPELAVKLKDITGTDYHLRNLYHHLIEDCEQLTTVNTLLTGISATTPLPLEEASYNNTQHLGQMHHKFPVAFSQRQAIRMYTDTQPYDILAISGPPGTGKTTLLQSMVATTVVDRVVRKMPPALIIASSTNNQAITNILDSFQIDHPSLLAQRWLPGVYTLGSYMSRKQNKKYLLIEDCYGKGFINSYEEEDAAERIICFKKQYVAFFGKWSNLKTAKKALYQEVLSRTAKLKNSLEIAHQLHAWKEKLGYKDLISLQHGIEQLYTNVVEASHQADLWEQLIYEIQIAYQKLSFKEKHLLFINKYRIRRTTCLKEVLSKYGLADTAFADYTQLLQTLDTQWKEAVEVSQKQEQTYQPVNKSWQAYVNWCDQWDELYGNQLTELHDQTQEYKALDVIEDINVRLDISYRFEAFWLAIHYREVDYLLRLKALQAKSPNQRSKERSKHMYIEKLRRIACLTPVFISTFHSLPRYATYYYKNKNCPYYNLFDVLIVDEAGQVAPDIGIPAFALAQKTIVVGDTKQIEPIWSVTHPVDYHLIKKYHSLATDEQLKQWKTEGRLTSSGNLMHLALQACAFGNEQQRGGLLIEHRRCLDPIIAYANQYVYQGKLKPMVGKKHHFKHTLPSHGYFHIPSVSKSQGSSRINGTDAEVIVQWLQAHKETLETTYAKAIHQIVAIITPYKAQAYQIRQMLMQMDSRSYQHMIVGTVHALQGAECPVIIYSNVLPNNSTAYVGGHYNLLNVATTRAKHSFLVFGNMGVFDPTQNNALGNLAKWLYAHPKGQLSNQLYYQSETFHSTIVERIHTLQKHIKVLYRAFERAKQELIIVSPYISYHAVNSKDLLSKIENAKNRGVAITVYTDRYLDRCNNSIILKKNTQKGRQLLNEYGVVLRIINGIHNKAIIIDNTILVEGSFNWLSAARDKHSMYHRYESSIVLIGDLASEPILQAKEALINLYIKDKQSNQNK